MRTLRLLLFLALFAASAPALGAEVADDFPWDPCQAYSNLITPRTVGDRDNVTRTVLQISVDDSAISLETGCVGERTLEANDLGPSFLPPLALLPNGRQNPNCPPGDNKHLQRNELNSSRRAATRFMRSRTAIGTL